MKLTNHMEGGTITSNNLISSIRNLGSEGREHETFKALLKNFLAPDMAIKENQSVDDKYVYTVPVKSPAMSYMSDRTKSLNEAKEAFLNSTVGYPNTATLLKKDNKPVKEEVTLHYAQIAVTTESEDSRSTGGGHISKKPESIKPAAITTPIDVFLMKKKIEQQQQPRKVSFKIKNASTSHRRPPLATKTMTIASNKVSELTKKFNNLVYESHNGTIKSSKLVKTIEDLQNTTKNSSASSTPSSTLSSSPNIKIVLRQKRTSKKRNNRKRCSSVDSIDKLMLSDSSSTKIRVIRSKSDGNKIPKSPKKTLNYQDSSPPSGSDSVDGSPMKQKPDTPIQEIVVSQSNVVKNVIKKFECEIIAQSNTNTLTKKTAYQSKLPTNITREKPKVPEKKSSLILTKNLVVKDGIPKIKTIKASPNELPKPELVKREKVDTLKTISKKEPIYDRRKYKTNYIHSEKMPLHVVEIIHEDANEAITINGSSVNEQEETPNNVTIFNTDIREQLTPKKRTSSEEKVYQEISSRITPNESFLWRRKSSTQIYSDSERSLSDSSYSLFNVTTLSEKQASGEPLKYEASLKSETLESQKNQSEVTVNHESDPNSDFESNLVEAYNKEVMIGFTPLIKPKELEIEDDYEPLEPFIASEEIPASVKKIDRTSKINCPLPEIPKEKHKDSPKSSLHENIYQCLLEMRSHPEGDESSLHSYELCHNQLEERTRGDGDSDNGYEYCKSPIKPYCHTSSSGIHIAENYQPFSKRNDKNYAISKSVSGASTISYEKIGSERIYEKISSTPSKSKESSPNSRSNRHSFISTSDYTGYNDGENIYDTIKHGDGTSLSHCYESIPNSPNMVKLRTNLKKQLASAVQKRLSFDTVSNISQSTMSSEQKTNSIYGQRSVISYNGQEIAFQVPSSETSVSDRSDRSDEWVDVSDEEKTEEQKIVIVRERSRGRKSPISWSQKVRHQWQKSPKQKPKNKVFITSPSTVYLDTSAKSPHYSQNDDALARTIDEKNQEREDNLNILEILEHKCWLSIRTVLRDGEFEIQDLIAFIEGDSSDSGHVYESLEPAPAPLDDDFDSFDSDTDSDTQTDQYESHPMPTYASPVSNLQRLPEPPSGGGGTYTLTSIASAAQRKIRALKRNLTKRYTVAVDGKTLAKSTSTLTNGQDKSKVKSPIYSNYEKPAVQHVYSNIAFPDQKPVVNKTEIPMQKPQIKEELRKIYGEVPPPLPDVPPPTTPTGDGKKDPGTLSRKAYLSFKSRFRRASSIAVDVSSDVPSSLKITNSTFYLTDSMDGDSGFSNCSDNTRDSSEALPSPPAPPRRRGTRPWAESAPCLALSRPALPPPPPPPLASADLGAVNEELKRLLPTLSRKEKGARTRTSWYAECGAVEEHHSPRPTSTSWYAEAGLYQAGNISSSSSSGASSGSHPASPLPAQHSLFTHEPLYQFYNAAKLESVCRETTDSDSDAYEASGGGGGGSVGGSCDVTAGPRPSAMALVSPRGPARTLWCEVPEVLASAVLSSLAPAQKRLQEAKFELLTSEASYLNSLNVLDAHFMSHPAFRDTGVLPAADRDALFSTILPVRRCSQQLMTSLERCWQENILLQGICELVRRHADTHFHVYVKYCEHQALMVKALQRLRERPAFSSTLRRLESHPSCQSLSLHSFLMLPMQRITRLPLLMDAVLKNLDEHDHEYQSCMDALATLNSFVSQCNEGARNTERIEEMYRLAQCIEFPASVRDPPALGPACHRRDRKPVRWLVRSGEMTQLVWKHDEMKLTFGKKFHKIPLHLFLFNDLLVITRRRGEESYIATDHCPRSLLEVCASDGGAAQAQAKHALLLTLLENHEGRTVEMLMSCPSATDASRWSEALSPAPAGGAEGEAVYAGWDCPQVAALYAYSPAQPDELPLTEGDIVNVTRKTGEGWYYGERIRDGETGWFPGAYTVEIASAHVRARNLRQRYRLLALSGTYLGQKKRAA